MGRLLAVDYGRKRSGIAVTDILQITANGLPTVRSCDLVEFIKEYVSREKVDALVVGDPKRMNGEPSENRRYIDSFLKHLSRELPDLPVIMMDERFTSVIAHREMIAGGVKKSDRQRKELADEMSAVLILNSYLDSRR